MSANSVKCPKCTAVLKSSRPIPAGVQLKCPKCQTTFKTPVEEEELVEPEIEEPDEVHVTSSKKPAQRTTADDFDEDDDDPPPRRGPKSARDPDDDDVDDLDELDELDELDDDEPPRKKRPRRDDDDDDLDDDDDRPRGKSKRARVDDDDEDDDRPSKKKPKKSKKKKKSKGNAGLIIGLAAGGGIAVVAIVGLLLFFLLSGSGLRSQLIGTWQLMEADGKPLPGFVSVNMIFTTDGDLKMSGMGRDVTIGKFRVSGSTLTLEGNPNANLGPGGGIPGGAAQIEIRGDQLILTGTDGGREKKLVLKKRNP